MKRTTQIGKASKTEKQTDNRQGSVRERCVSALWPRGCVQTTGGHNYADNGKKMNRQRKWVRCLRELCRCSVRCVGSDWDAETVCANNGRVWRQRASEAVTISCSRTSEAMMISCSEMRTGGTWWLQLLWHVPPPRRMRPKNWFPCNPCRSWFLSYDIIISYA